MTDIRNYLFKNVILIDIDGKEWSGYVFSFHDKADNDDGEDSITLKLKDNSDRVIEFTLPEIKSITIDLKQYVGKDVIIIDDDGKKWRGIVDSYNSDDDVGDYVGETLDICVDGSPNDMVCLTKPQIKSITLA